MNRLIIYTVLASITLSQSTYRDFLKKAWEHYQAKEYMLSGNSYLKAFKIEPELKTENQFNARFNAVCAWSLAKNADQAFILLSKMANTGNYTNVDQLETDTDLSYLRTDSRWPKLIKKVIENYERVKPLDKAALTKLFNKFMDTHKKVFQKGSTVDDVDKLYSFYTDDFIYNHPGYGGEYSRELLYNNTVRSLKAGRYNKSKKRHTLKTIIGKNAVAIEQKYEDEEETTMTLFKFRKDKIYYIHEYW